MDETTFEKVKVGETFIPFPGMPNRTFTKVTPQRGNNFPGDAYCGGCGQKPVLLNATEKEGRRTLYQHFCPTERVWIMREFG